LPNRSLQHPEDYQNDLPCASLAPLISFPGGLFTINPIFILKTEEPFDMIIRDRFILE